MELDHGTQHIIDVQPDLRFPFQYFLYNIVEQFPDLTVKAHPFVSTFSLIAYQQMLFNAYILICDLYSREVVSYNAAKFKNDPAKMDFLTKLLNCYVPPDLEPVLNAFAPTFDPQRRLQLYVLSFSEINVQPTTQTGSTQELSDIAYSKYVKFLCPGPSFKSSLTPPPTDIDTAFYLVSKDPYNPDIAPFPYETFDRNTHLTPDVLWFQPYSKNPSALNYALTLGLLIETGDLDGVTIPIANIAMSLTENNSMYMQGTLPLTHTLKYIPSNEEHNRFRLMSREVHSDLDQPVGLSLRDCSTVMVPRFASERVRSNMNCLYGVTIHENCNDNEANFTNTASTHPSPPPIPIRSVHLWSSYRYVSKSNTPRRKIYQYSTLRQFYSENVTISRTRNPVFLLP
ncbi:hypothetical protein WA026_021513 [Henosepilachna vigintioctopunctata]|uniref:Uncharacterized protein n=1 Tax=Henosepilachna vigintioctopunctata TaxID=420089 RepID=A0AAW1VD12_9CUCU